MWNRKIVTTSTPALLQWQIIIKSCMKRQIDSFCISTLSIVLLLLAGQAQANPADNLKNHNYRDADNKLRQVEQLAEVGDEDVNKEKRQKESLKARQAPAESKIEIVPFFTSGQPITVLLTDASGNALPNTGLYLNDELLVSDAKGTVSFRIPEVESIELALIGEGRRKIAKRKFNAGEKGIFSENQLLHELAASIIRIDTAKGKAPVLSYVPSTCSPGEVFAVTGHNFSAIPEDNYLEIDGFNAPVLSASPDALLAVAPLRLQIGPLRELSLTVKGQAANTMDIDVATPYFSHLKTDDDDVSPERGKLGMNGTNIACLIRLVNNDTEHSSLWSPKQEPLGKVNIVLSPGGSNNFLDIDLRLLSPEIKAKVELSLAQDYFTNYLAQKIPPQLLKEACRAEIIRIERRKIAAEYRLQAIRQSESDELLQAKASRSDNERLETESKALSLRLLRLRKMLVARRLIFEALGNTDGQFRQVLDDASSGALLTLDRSVKPIQIISDGAVGYAASETAPAPGKKKGRPLRMLEPVIRLLPPMNEHELSQLKARSGPGSGNSMPGSQTVSVESHSPQLRPSLPEPEPEVKGKDRGSLPGTETRSQTSAAGSKSQTTSKTQAAGSKTQAGKKTPAGKSNTAKSNGSTKSKSAQSSKSTRHTTSSANRPRRRKR